MEGTWHDRYPGRPPIPVGSEWAFDRRRIIAGAGFNRWLVPPAALCIHLCIGMAYGFSVFWLPLSKALGISKSIACAAGSGWLDELFATTCDWSVGAVTWAHVHSVHCISCVSAAALWGGWLERVGPRKGRSRRGVVLGRRLPDWRTWHLYSPALAHLAWYRRHRWGWLGPGVHFAGFHFDQVVSRSPRHGDRHGHHGLPVAVRWTDRRWRTC